MPKGVYPRIWKPLRNRLLDRVEKDEETQCWLWLGGTTTNGYGVIGRGGKHGTMLAHRAAYTELVGSIPKGMTIDHLCRVRLCVNPEHLEVVTLRENILRGESPSAQAARRDDCANGHPYTKETIYMYGGARHCRICQHETNRRTYNRRRQDASS